MQIKKLDMLSKSTSEAIEKTRADMQGIRSMQISDMPKGGQSQSLDDVLAKYEELQNKYNSIIERYIEAKNQCMAVIEKMDDPILQCVIIEKYFNYRQWTEIASMMNYAESHIYRMHGYALRAFQRHDDSK